MESDFSFNHQYTLRWNDYHQKLVNSFQSLHDADDFVDVTIACEGKSFSAHKVVLSACSPYFRRLLKANPCSHPIVILQTIPQKQFECLLNFMYHGVVHIEPETLHDFLNAANELQIQGLTDIQYPRNEHSRKISIESDNSMCSTNIHDSTEIPVYSEQKRKNNEQEPHTSGNPHSTETSKNDLSNIDHILDMNFPSPNPTAINQTVKTEPIEELVIDEDAFDQNSSESSLKPSNISHLSESDHYTPQPMNLSDNVMAMRNYRDPTNSESNVCVVCKRNYSSASNLRAHVLNVHIQTSKTNWFQCSVCGKKCKTKHYLINHEMQKHGIRQRNKMKSSSFDLTNDDTL